jgi:hypothetical protein
MANSITSPSPSKAVVTTAVSPPTSNFSMAPFPVLLVPWEALTTLSLLQRSTPSPAPTSVSPIRRYPSGYSVPSTGTPRSSRPSHWRSKIRPRGQDWGIYTDICHYHHVDTQLTHIATRIRALEAEEAETHNTLANCCRCLRTANIGETLAHLAGNDSGRHNQHHGEGIIRYAAHGHARI